MPEDKGSAAVKVIGVGGGITALREHVDSLAIIHNDSLLGIASKKASFPEILAKAKKCLASGSCRGGSCIHWRQAASPQVWEAPAHELDKKSFRA